MFRCVVKNHVMGVVVQERSTTFHRAKDTTLAFDTQGRGSRSLPARLHGAPVLRTDGYSSYPG